MILNLLACAHSYSLSPEFCFKMLDLALVGYVGIWERISHELDPDEDI